MSITVSNAGGTVASSAGSVSQAFAGNITSGNRIVILCASYDAGNSGPFVVADCTKTAGTATIGTIALDVNRSYNHFGGEAIKVGIWSASVTGTGSCTMQIDDDGSSYFVIGIAEISSNEGAITLDVGQTTSAEAATGAPDSGSLTPSRADAVFVGGLVTSVGSSTTHTPDGAFSQIFESENGAADQTGSFIYRVVTSASADSASWTAPTTIPWAAALAIYVEPAAAGSPSSSISSSPSASVSASVSPSASATPSSSISASPSSSASASISPSPSSSTSPSSSVSASPSRSVSPSPSASVSPSPSASTSPSSSISASPSATASASVSSSPSASPSAGSGVSWLPVTETVQGATLKIINAGMVP